MRSSGVIDQLKSKLFEIEQYNDIVTNFKNQIQGFNHYEKRLLRNGRHSQFYEKLTECVHKSVNKKQEKITCIKENLHKECLGDYMDFKKCLDKTKNKNDCNTNLGEYFICIDGSIK